MHHRQQKAERRGTELFTARVPAIVRPGFLLKLKTQTGHQHSYAQQ